jgi:hypothetical protein
MTDDSIEIIKLLREARLGWIADELVESIALGRQTSKEFREPGTSRATRASAIEPLNPEEEMALIVETLAQYFIVMPKAWRAARARFARKGTFSKVQVKEEPWLQETAAAETEDFAVVFGIAGDGEEAFHDFSDAYENQSLPALRGILSKLWPQGAEDFSNLFAEEEEKK